MRHQSLNVICYDSYDCLTDKLGTEGRIIPTALQPREEIFWAILLHRCSIKRRKIKSEFFNQNDK